MLTFTKAPSVAVPTYDLNSIGRCFGLKPRYSLTFIDGIMQLPFIFYHTYTVPASPVQTMPLRAMDKIAF